MADYYETRAEEIYQRLISGKAVSLQDAAVVLQRVQKKLEDAHKPPLNLYNKGNELFYSLEPGEAVGGAQGTSVTEDSLKKGQTPKTETVETPKADAKKATKDDPLSPTPEHEAKAEISRTERLNAIAENVLKREPTETASIPTPEEIEALKYYASLGKNQMREVSRFVHNFAEANLGALSNANIDDIKLQAKHNYYMDKIHTWDNDDVAKRRSEGDVTAQPKTTQELCPPYVTDHITRGHEIAAFILDINEKNNTDYYKGLYPHAFEGISKLRSLDSENHARSQDEVAAGRSELDASLQKSWCKP